MWKKGLLVGMCAALTLVLYAGETVIQADGNAEIMGESRYIALTFDDGPKEGTTNLLLDGLKERGASATFFVVGEQAAKYPELVKRMQAEGHQVGNHTWGHVRLENAAPAALEQEIGRTEALLSSLLGGKGYWLRPPYGIVSPEVKVTVPVVKWSVDPRDWESRNTEKVTQAVLEAAQPNSIILLHDIYPTSVEAALKVVDALQAKGYWFVTVEELLQLNGVTPEAGVMYRKGTGN